MPSADQVPTKSSHSRMRGGNWVVREEGGLARRLPNSKPTGLTFQQEQDVRLRIRRGERADDLARIFGIEPAAIGQLAR